MYPRPGQVSCVVASDMFVTYALLPLGSLLRFKFLFVSWCIVSVDPLVWELTEPQIMLCSLNC